VQTLSAANEFGGEESFASPPEQVYALLTDLDAMASTIPDLVSSERVDDRTLKCVIKPGFSFLRGTMRTTIALGECTPNDRAAMNVEAAGIGVGMVIGSQLDIQPEGTGSRLIWRAKIEQRKGLLAAVSPSLIRGAADQVIRHTWNAVRLKLGEV